MKLEVTSIADQILKAINTLGAEGQRSEELIQAKANTTAEYDKAVSLAILTLKAKETPISIINKMAAGNCSDLLIKQIVAEETLKAHYSKIERIQAQLNALQSIYRHLSHTTQGQNQ